MITTNAIHQYLTAVNHGLSLSSSYLMSTSTIPVEKVSCDSFCLWQCLPLHTLQHGYKVCLDIRVPFHCHWLWLILCLLYPFYQGHTEILSQCLLNILLIDANSKNIVTSICVTWNIWYLRLICFKLPSICSVSHHKIGRL